MLSAAGMVEEEARQRFRKLREAKEVTQLWCSGHSMHSMSLLHSEEFCLHVGYRVLRNLDCIFCMYVEAVDLLALHNA